MQLMDTSSFSLALVLLILSSVTLATSSSSSTDQDALIAFKNGITSDPHSVVSKNWSTDASICSWTGVSCSVDNQRVMALNLSGFLLEGTISPHLGNLTFLQSLDMSSNNFTGSIPSELFNISGLQTINLSSNQLVGTLPNGICSNTPKLERIYLSSNRFHGEIPKSLYQCTELVELSLVENQFNGNIPSEIGNLTKLGLLDIANNLLEGEIPPSIFNISALEILELSNNSLSGSIHIFDGCTRLRHLSLESSSLTGGIPKEIGHLTSLKSLILSNSRLTGHIPKQIGNLTLLKVLYLDGNNLTGELPGELGNLKSLEILYASKNEFLTGIIPPSIFNISTLQKVDLQENQFSGSLPPEMGLSLFNLEEFVLKSNRLSGKIPASISNASMLITLDLSANSFTGSIPDFGNLGFLQYLRLWNNSLTGAESPNQELTFLSSLTNCRDLLRLELSNNPFMSGILPASIGNLSTSLTTFTAYNCSIQGAIPSEIGNLSSLQVLDLSTNKLVGFIPATIGMLKQLGNLLLLDNQLRGYIPRDLCQMPTLIILYLSGNMLTGPIPECLWEVKSLRYVVLASNRLNSTLPSEFLNPDLLVLDLSSNNLSGQLPELGSLRAIYHIELSSNKFSGIIPSSIDGCGSLENLYLRNNMFNGSIPQSLGEVKGLRSLDLSNNNLSGLIPKSLENLKLVWFNVSGNHLEGKIPEEGCFVNFEASSFLDNPGLCGAERFQVQSCPKHHPRSTSKSVAVLMMKYVVPSFIACMFVVVGILILIRRRRPKEKLPTIENSSEFKEWKIVSEKELEQGTSSFSETNLLGRGGIGSVFKATLADGTHVAVKVFNLQVEGATKIFDTESRILGTIRHRNLVKTLGCCSNPGFKALILAYMPNGSLDACLHSGKHRLELVERVKIAIDVAFALEYLHHGHTFPIVHCDIKPSNVLLDEDMTAHVGDFGISKLFDNGEAAVHTITMATIGYAAPEFGSEGKVSTGGDVYSYGILLLEMFTSKRPTDDMFSGEMSIKEWVGKALQENATSEVVAPGLLSREDRLFTAKEQCVSSIFNLAMKCLAFSPEERMDMMQVVAALEKIHANFIAEEIRKKQRK